MRADARSLGAGAPARALGPGLAPRLAWAACGVAAALAFVALAFVALRRLAPDADPDHALCWLRRTAHLACPTCGLTRALAALARGEWRAALTLHPMVFPLAAEAAWLWARVGGALWGAGSAPRAQTLLRLAAANAAALLLLWLARLATGTLPS